MNAVSTDQCVCRQRLTVRQTDRQAVMRYQIAIHREIGANGDRWQVLCSLKQCGNKLSAVRDPVGRTKSALEPVDQIDPGQGASGPAVADRDV